MWFGTQTERVLKMSSIGTRLAATENHAFWLDQSNSLY